MLNRSRKRVGHLAVVGGNRKWIGYFVVVGVLGVVAAGVLIWFNMQQQLTSEKLQVARELWQKNGPKDYNLTIKKKISGAGSTGPPEQDEFGIQVRGEKVVSGTINGRPLETRLFRDYDMEAWLDYIEDFLKRDARPDSPRVFAVARFDPQTGALRHYVRSVGASQERQELTLEVKSP